MKKYTYLLILLLWIGAFDAKAQNDLRINEIMISNIDGYMVDYDFPDSWIELYNPTNKNINLNGYTLRLTTDITEEYSFVSNKIILAEGYLVICCDKGGKGIHTSFRLDAEGGTITLLNAENQVVEELTYPAMISPQIGYGKNNDRAWQWEKEATPGAQNTGLFTDAILPNPIFSNHGHIMSRAETVDITMPQGFSYPADTRIFITYNGQEPTIDSESATSFHLQIDKSTVIRAKLLSNSALSPMSVTQSYIFHPRKTDIPIVSIATDDKYLFDDTLGIWSDKAALGAMPNYKRDWRRPVNIEYMKPDGRDALFNQMGETGLSGYSSRKNNQKSMKFYANKRFGEKRFKGRLWEEKDIVEKNKSFIFRNGGSACYTSRINDASMQMLFGTHIKNIDYQSYQPAIMYINGEYHGIYGLRERSNEDYVYGNYNGLEDIEVATQDAYKGNYLTETPLFQEFYETYHREDVTYQELERLMDIENFMNVYITECFSSNHDFPHNNISMWRSCSEGGKWKWILKDLDVLSNKNFNMFKYILGTNNTDDQEYAFSQRTGTVKARVLYEKMMSFPEFKDKFLDIFSVYLGDFCKPSISTALVSQMSNEIKSEIEPTAKVYNIPELKNFDNNIKKLKTYYNDRPRIVYNQMAEYFSLGDVIPMSLQTGGEDVKINEVGLTEGDFDGCYFSDRELRLNSGANNVGWKMTAFRKEKVAREYTFPKQKVALKLKNYTKCDSVVFETMVFNISEFEQKLQELEIVKPECTDWSDELTVKWDEPRYAYANITVDALPTGKYDDVQAFIDLYDNNGNYMRKPVLLNLQGSSEPMGSTGSPTKVNLSVAFCDEEWTDEEAPSLTFGTWVAQDEFHLKAFQEDGLRGTAEIAYKLYDQMLGIEEGARLTADAFPMSLYVNGNFYGVMAWQLKKHRKNMDLIKDDGKQVWLDGKVNDKQLFGGTINWTKFEVRNPKDLYNMDGTDYDGDNPQEIIDATSEAYTGKKKMMRCAEAKDHIIALSQYCGELEDLESEGATTEEMREAISKRFDTESLINYVVFSLVTNNYDGFSDNWQWYTRDGKHWAVVPYNCELTFGYNEEGTSLWEAEKSSKKYDYKMENALANGPIYWLAGYYWDEVKERYADLRDSDIITADNIAAIANSWYDRIGKENYDAEFAKWADSPCVTHFTDSKERFGNWIKKRIELQDKYLDYTISGDINGDGKVSIADMPALIYLVTTNCEYSPHYDVNKDGHVNQKDINALKAKLLHF